jgi:hypothetical protein
MVVPRAFRCWEAPQVANSRQEFDYALKHQKNRTKTKSRQAMPWRLWIALKGKLRGARPAQLL